MDRAWFRCIQEIHAQLDMIQLETSDDFMSKNADVLSSTAWRLESLREFKNFKPVNFLV